MVRERRAANTEDAMKKLVFGLVAFLLSTAALAAVNLNTASKDELVGLPGIGPAKAQAIVDYRTANGPFKSVEDVRKVKGIGEKLFQQLKPELSVSGGAKVAAAAPATQAGGKADARADSKPAARSDAGKIARDEKPRK
jgi:competence protein ComEA